VAEMYQEAGLAAIALIRGAAERSRGREEFLPGSLVAGYLARVRTSDDPAGLLEPMSILISALTLFGGALARALLAATPGSPGDLTGEQLRSKMDDVEIAFLRGGGFRA
jgi:hypothetical protein